MVWGRFLIAIAAAALKTPTRNGYNAQGVNLNFNVKGGKPRVNPSARHEPLAAYAAPVVEGVQEHAFCLREIIHLRMALEARD